jgi:hypothetical protein
MPLKGVHEPALGKIDGEPDEMTFISSHLLAKVETIQMR